MFKKILSLTLAALLLNVAAAIPARAGAQVVEKTQNVERVRENVRRLGTGEAARVELKLWDGRRLKGYISGARADDFSIVDAKTGAVETAAYAEVRQVKGSNRLTAAKVGITLAKGAAVVGAVALGTMLLLLVSLPKS